MSELHQFDSIFEACCQRLELGASIEDCLAGYPELSRYPAQAAELRGALTVAQQMAQIRPPAPPSPRLHGDIRQRFMAEAHGLAGPQTAPSRPTPRRQRLPAAGQASLSQPAPSRPRPPTPAPRPSWMARAFGWLLAPRPIGAMQIAVVALLLVLSFSAATVSLAQPAIPGDILYPFKKSIAVVGRDIEIARHPDQAEQTGDSFDRARVAEVKEALLAGRTINVTLQGLIAAVYPNEFKILLDPGLVVWIPPELWSDDLQRGRLVSVTGQTNPDRGEMSATQVAIPISRTRVYILTRPTPTLPPTPTLAPSRTPKPRPTIRPTVTRRPPTRTPRPLNTPRRTPTPTVSLIWTPTPTPTGDLTVTPTPTGDLTVTPTPTGEPTATPTGEPTATPTGEPTATPTGEPTATPTGEPTATPTGEPTATPTGEPTATPTGEPTATPTGEPTATPTGEPTTEATATPDEPTATPTGEPTATPIPPTATPDEPTATAIPPTAAPDEPTATAIPPTATPDEPAAPPVTGVSPAAALSQAPCPNAPLCPGAPPPPGALSNGWFWLLAALSTALRSTLDTVA